MQALSWLAVIIVTRFACSTAIVSCAACRSELRHSAFLPTDAEFQETNPRACLDDAFALCCASAAECTHLAMDHLNQACCRHAASDYHTRHHREEGQPSKGWHRIAHPANAPVQLLPPPQLESSIQLDCGQAQASPTCPPGLHAPPNRSSTVQGQPHADMPLPAVCSAVQQARCDEFSKDQPSPGPCSTATQQRHSAA